MPLSLAPTLLVRHSIRGGDVVIWRHGTNHENFLSSFPTAAPGTSTVSPRAQTHVFDSRFLQVWPGRGCYRATGHGKFNLSLHRLFGHAAHHVNPSSTLCHLLGEAVCWTIEQWRWRHFSPPPNRQVDSLPSADHHTSSLCRGPSSLLLVVPLSPSMSINVRCHSCRPWPVRFAGLGGDSSHLA